MRRHDQPSALADQTAKLANLADLRQLALSARLAMAGRATTLPARRVWLIAKAVLSALFPLQPSLVRRLPSSVPGQLHALPFTEKLAGRRGVLLVQVPCKPSGVLSLTGIVP